MLQKLSGRRNLSPAISIVHVLGFAPEHSKAGATVIRATREPSGAAQTSPHAVLDACISRFIFSRASLGSCFPCKPSVGDTSTFCGSYGRRRFGNAVAEQLSEPTTSSESPSSEAWLRYRTISHLCEILEANPWGNETVNQLEGLTYTFTSDAVVRVIRAVSSPACSFSFFKWLSSTGYDHDTITCNAMLDVLGEAGCINDMKLLIGNIREAGLKFDGSLYDTLVRWLVHHGDGMTALSLSEKMKEEGLAWSASTYTSVLNLYVKEGKYEKAVNAFLQMVEDSVVPSSETFSHLIRFLLEAGKLEYAQKVYLSLPTLRIQPTQSIFAYLMSTYAKVGDLQMLKALGKELRGSCHVPGNVLRIAFHSLQIEGKHGAVDSFAKEVWPDLTVQDRNAKAQHIENLSTLSARDEDQLQEQLEHLQCTDRKVNVAVAELIRLLENDGISVLDQVMVDWTAIAVSKTLRQFKNPALAWEFFKWVRASPGYMQNLRNEVAVLRMLAKSCNFPAFKEFLLDLQSSTEFSLEIFNSLIKECAVAKNAQAAMWVYSRIKVSNLRPDEETFSFLVQAFARGQNPDKASDLCFVMQDVGLKPDVETYTAVIHSLGLAGRADDAWSLYQRMCAVGLRPNGSTYTAMLNAMNVVGNNSLGIKIFEEMNAKGVSPTEATQGIMAGIWEASGNLTESQKLVAQQKYLSVKRREDALQKIYELLLEGLVEHERSPSLLSFG